MLISWVMFFAFIASLVLPVVAVVGVVTYIRRTGQLQESTGDGSPHAAVLESLDQVHVRLDAMSDRLTRPEEALRLGYVTPRQVQELRKDRDAFLGEGRE